MDKSRKASLHSIGSDPFAPKLQEYIEDPSTPSAPRIPTPGRCPQSTRTAPPGLPGSDRYSAAPFAGHSACFCPWTCLLFWGYDGGGLPAPGQVQAAVLRQVGIAQAAVLQEDPALIVNGFYGRDLLRVEPGTQLLESGGSFRG